MMSFRQYSVCIYSLTYCKEPQGLKLILVRNYSAELGDIMEDFKT